MKKFVLLLLLLFACPRLVHAQTAPITARAVELRKAGNFADAQQLIEAQLAKTQVKDQQDELHNALADVHFHQGKALEKIYDFEGAIACYQKAYETDMVLRRSNAAIDLTNIGVAYDSLSRYDEALRYYQMALPIYQQLKYQFGEATTLNNMSITYLNLSRYEEALHHLQMALPIFQEIKDRRSEARTLAIIGSIYGSLSRYEEEVRYDLMALPILQEIKDRQGEAVVLNSMGVAGLNLRSYEVALRCFQIALPICREVKDRFVEANTLGNIGEAYNNLSRSEEAIRYFQMALPIFQEIRSLSREAVILSNIGGAYQKLSRYGDAMHYYQMALPIQHEIKDREGEATTLNNIMLAQRQQKQPELAIVYGKQAVNVIQSIRGDIAGLDKTSRDAYLQGNKDPYENLAALLIEQGRLPEAEAVNRLLRESETVAFVRAGDAGGAAAPLPFYASEQRFLEQDQTLAGQANLVGEKLAALSAIKSDKRTAAQQREWAALKAQDEALRARFRALTTALIRAMNDPDAAKTMDFLDSAEWRKSLRDLEAQGAGKVAWLSTVMAPDKFYVILTTAYGSEDFSVPVGKVEVEKLAATAAAALQNPRTDPRPALLALYRVMFCDGQLESALQRAQISTAVWLVGGNLRSIPLDALYDGEHYLLEHPRQNIGMTLHTRAYLETPRVGEVLAVGTSEAHTVEMGVGTPSPSRFAFGPLANVPAELRGIARDGTAQGTGPFEGVILLDGKPAFTAAQLETKASDGYAILHMATHFSVGLEDTSSFFLLGDGTPFTVADWANKIPMTDLELLTLSACDTGDSKLEQSSSGAKIGTLSEIAQKNGAHSVIVTLWSVNDASTSLLMRDFYARWQAQPSAGKGAALREAQRALLGVEGATINDKARGPNREAGADEAPDFVRDQKHPFAHPFYWAPFTLVGNWR